MATHEIGRISDGMITSEGGVDSGLCPNLIRKNQLAWARNMHMRGGERECRHGFTQMRFLGESTPDLPRLNFQGFGHYEDQTGRGYVVFFAGGRTFTGSLSKFDCSISEITISGDPNSSVAQRIWSRQADRYLVIQDASSKPMIYDGSSSRRAAIDEVPIGSGPMVYGNGRLGVAIGNEYVFGDILGGPTGVLKFTENDYLNEGGSFAVPLQSGQITGMEYTASPNTALGQGELLITTPDCVYSVILPTNRDAWKDTTDIIQRVIIINNGSMSDAITLVNGDAFIRSRDGVRSVIQAVRDFSQMGNVPISREMSRAFNSDPQALLKHTSSIFFDSRYFCLTGARYANNGAIFKQIGVYDLDLVSSNNTRLPPAWNGVWEGYDFLRLFKGRFGSVDRAFFAARNPNKGFVKSIIVKTDGVYGSLTPKGVTITDSDGGSSKLEVVPHYCWKDAPVIVNPGTGYTVGTVITLNASISSDLKISEPVYVVSSVGGGGAVTGLTQVAGRFGDYLDKVNGPYPTVSSGAGTGLTLGNDCRLFKLDPKKVTDLPTIAVAGTGYTVNDIITLSGPTPKLSDAQYKVEAVDGGGGITKISQVAGKYGQYSVRPNGTYGVTGGTGTGCTLKMPGSPATYTSTTPPIIEPIFASGLEAYCVLDFEWEFWEMVPGTKFDFYIDDTWVRNERRISWSFVSPSYNFATDVNVLARDTKMLIGAELWIDRITGTLDCSMEWTNDQHPLWIPWHSWDHKALYKNCGTASNCVPVFYMEQHRSRVCMPQPKPVCDTNGQTPRNESKEFQFRFSAVGFGRVKMVEMVAKKTPEPTRHPCPTSEHVSGLEFACDEL